ncbi:MAG: hypothetical protein HC836_15580 [Richelia sp. RM2_1_2]|nr:hypothetical protein [Richelia sp. RM2_1_2]
MAKVRVVNGKANQDLVGNNFTNDATQTIFQLGAFTIESNFTGRRITDYRNTISSFVTPITLENLNIDDIDSEKIFNLTSNVVLNLDKSDLKSYAKFGSTKEMLRVAIEQIILNYPASIYADNKLNYDGNITIVNYTYDPLTDITEFEIPTLFITNKFGLITGFNNFATPDNNALKNLNLSYQKYVIWRSNNATGNTNYIIGYTGDSPSYQFLSLRVQGNPFPEISATGLTASTAAIEYHIKPEPLEFNKFTTQLEPLERHLLAKRTENETGFVTKLKEPTQLDDGRTIYTERSFVWPTGDKYNVDIGGSVYTQYIITLMNLGAIYDEIKTDLVYRLLTTSSLKKHDNTDEQKMSKLLRIYGREIDNIRQYIDALVNINTVTYNKNNNIPDTLVKNYATTLGWDITTLVTGDQLEEQFFATEEQEENGIKLPSEIDIELWRRIIINTNYYWKSKGTRHSLKSMLRLIGIPEQFVDITEYVYTVDGRIDPSKITLTLEDIGTPSLPYNSQGYPIAPKENNDFFFQISGDTDGGQAYINVYRKVGFSVNRTIDNKKSWEQAGFVDREHYSTPTYSQRSSALIINTKEIDATLDVARGIEYDVYNYNKLTNYPINTTGVTKPFIYVNIAYNYGMSANTFTIPETPLGDIQVNFNGITLTSGITGNGDYTVAGNVVTLNTEYAVNNTNGTGDVITITYMHDKLSGTGGDYSQVKYVITRPVATNAGMEIPLPTGYTLSDSGDVQLTVNGITLSKSTSLYTGDFIIAPTKDKLIVQNVSLANYLQTNPVITVAYVYEVNGEGLVKKTEVHRVDSFSSSKLTYNPGINKFIYTMDFEAFDLAAIKVVLNGITLQNGSDFTLNGSNKYQIYLPPSLNFGDIIGVYYVISSKSTSSSFLPPNTNFPNINSLSFLEYLELITRKLINAKNRKVITDNNGGFYPTVLKIYEEYLRMSFLPENNFLHSNGYTYSNLFPFIGRFSAFFQRFVTGLLPATIILKKGGVVIRNTAFTRQKYTYKRGVNFNPKYQWLGDDGSEFIVPLPDITYAWSSEYVCVENDILEIEDIQVIL